MGKKVYLLLLPILVIATLCACDRDDHYEEKTENNEEYGDSTSTEDKHVEEYGDSTSTEDKHVNMYYTVICGSDLLQFVKPEVTYTEADGRDTTVLLTYNDWEIYSTEKTEESEDSVVVSYKWEKKVVFNHYNVTGMVSVKYLPLMDYSDMYGMMAAHDRMSHWTDIKATNKENPSRGLTIYIGNPILIGENAIVNYIKEVCDTIEKKSCYVSDDGTITYD